MSPNPILIKLEKRYQLGPTFVARLMGLAYPTYAAYRAGSRELPRYHQCFANSLMLHDEEARQQLIKEHVNAPRSSR